MKKLLWLPVIGLVVASTMVQACRSITTITNSAPITTTSISPTTSSASSTVPSDFYIIYEMHRASVPLLDTKNHAIGARGSSYTVDFYIPCGDLQALYDAIITYDIKSLSGIGIIVDPNLSSQPHHIYTVTFCLDGMIYSVSYDNAVVDRYSYSKERPELRAFHHILNNYYESTNEYLSFPPPPLLT